MRSLTTSRLLMLGVLLCGAGAVAAEENWELFATSQSAKVYFDRGSVKETEGYVH